MTYKINDVEIINSSTQLDNVNDLTVTGDLKLTGAVHSKITSVSASSGTASIDCAADGFFSLTDLTQATTTISLSNVEIMQPVTIKIPSSTTNLSWPTITWSKGSAPAITSSTTLFVFLFKNPTGFIYGNYLTYN
jgi:hypothetical protein